jgi:hypothetical protein
MRSWRDLPTATSRATELGEALPITETLLDTIEKTFGTMRRFAVRADERVAKSPRASDTRDLWALRSIWLYEDGLRDRPWFRNLIAGTDRDSGYATASWPLLREAILDASPGDPESENRIMVAADAYLEAQAAMWALLEHLLGPEASGGAAKAP